VGEDQIETTHGAVATGSVTRSPYVIAEACVGTTTEIPIDIPSVIAISASTFLMAYSFKAWFVLYIRYDASTFDSVPNFYKGTFLAPIASKPM
jgi:hypothetical protein